MAGKKEKDSTHSRWQRITISDVMCGFYWFWFFVTFIVLTNIREDFNEFLLLDSLPRKLVFIFSSWLLTIAFFQTALSQKGYLKALFKWLMLPASVVRITFGFLFDSRKSWKKLKNNFPLKRVMLLSLPISYLAAFYFIEPIITRP